MISFSFLYNYSALGSETKVLGFDGTLYNKPEKYPSEIEFIISVVNEYGEEFPNYLQGMFSICVWDGRRQQLLAVRDRMGECTLYYCHTPEGIVVSTDIRSILQQYLKKPQINIQHFLEPLRFTGPVDMENTWVEQIKRIQPGECLEISCDGIRKLSYWKRRRTYCYKGTAEEAKSKILSLLKESVCQAFNGGEKVAVMLSGGIDSSAIAAIAKLTGHEVHTITTGYAGDFSCDERDVARRFAKEQGFIHHEIVLNDEDYVKAFEELTRFIDEPITDSAVMAQWCMFKKVKQLGFDVLLGGMGGDELFYGYPAWNNMSESLHIRREHESIFPWNSTEKKKHYICFVTKHLKHILYAGYPQKIEDKSFGWWIYEDFYKFEKGATISMDGSEYNLCDYPVYKDFPPCELGKEIDMVYDDCINRVMTGAYLFLSKRLGDGAGLEIRSPLLDYKFVEFVMSLPLDIKYVQSKPKQFFKDVLAGIVPDYILYASKRGFTPPTPYVKSVADSHQYKFINTKHGFYNSALADQMLCHLWKQ